MAKGLRSFLQSHKDEISELIRYAVAGVLTTILSILLDYAACLVLVNTSPGLTAFSGGGWIDRAKWLEENINLADAGQKAIASVFSWVFSVLFAYGINRKMVFRVESRNRGVFLKGLAEFAGGRVVSYAVFELGLMELLKLWGVPNVSNRLIVTAAVTVFNYIVSKFWVFRKEKAPE